MDQEIKKLSYEELERAMQQLSVQVDTLQKKNAQLVEMVNNTNFANIMKRLEWLWLVITTKDIPLTEDFISKCAKEFMEIMTPENTEE